MLIYDKWCARRVDCRILSVDPVGDQLNESARLRFFCSNKLLEAEIRSGQNLYYLLEIEKLIVAKEFSPWDVVIERARDGHVPFRVKSPENYWALRTGPGTL